MTEKTLPVAASLKAARQQLGVPQREFARRVGVHAMTISQWERGVRLPSLENMLQVSQVTGRPLEWFTKVGAGTTGS